MYVVADLRFQKGGDTLKLSSQIVYGCACLYSKERGAQEEDIRTRIYTIHED